ncbi:DUF2851 family protein [Mesonia maritima]|uniref:DUF2851 family protein n=1 Tax=Mesonia maritima TaxID=1793873 RepID=A0ABU1K9L0_9FLAO|nr:DUF2851 family protein [Mesonia maritima]MDR6301187.1 hypothetical protein [Mesonia maritima]
MQEAFLHYCWKFKKFDFLNAETSAGENIQLLSVGQHNESESGPDFFNAKLKIDEQVWAGNVEIHLKSSDWYAHHHEKDTNYDNVILHVVWKHDVEIYRKNNTEIPCLELKNYVPPKFISNYKNLLQSNYRWINCENEFHEFPDFLLQHWLERLFIERLEEKSERILKLLAESNTNWEAVLFQLLAKNFGLNKNGNAFLEMAGSIPFSAVQKTEDVFQLEAIFFGQANMLEEEKEDAYYNQLRKEYKYLKRKFHLKKHSHIQVEYFRLRPSNFPTIRLSQLAMFYGNAQHLFSKIIQENSLDKIYQLLEVETSAYWKSHYSFGKESKEKSKKVSKNFINLVIINTLVPLKFCYQKYIGKNNSEELVELMRELPAEKNSVIKKFNSLRKKTATNALESQALLQLKPNYCDKNRCLHCKLGLSLLQKTRD